MRTQTPVHRYAIGDVVSLDLHDGGSLKLNPFTVEARMPPVGVSLQYRIKSTVELCRRVVSEHQLSSVDDRPAAPTAVLVAPGFDEAD